jgi:hypothetical protein
MKVARFESVFGLRRLGTAFVLEACFDCPVTERDPFNGRIDSAPDRFRGRLHDQTNFKHVLQIHIARMESRQHYIAKKFPIPISRKTIEGLIAQLTFYKREDGACSA